MILIISIKHILPQIDTQSVAPIIQCKVVYNGTK